MQEALEVLVGPEAKGLSSSVVSRLKREREAEYADWCRRDVGKDRWVHGWADGIDSGALGFWAASDEVYPETRHSRCWLPKRANVLNYLPKRVQPKAKRTLQEPAGDRDGRRPKAEDWASAYKAFEIGMPCRPSTISRLSTGCTYGRRIRSSRSSPRFDIGLSGPKDV